MKLFFFAMFSLSILTTRAALLQAETELGLYDLPEIGDLAWPECPEGQIVTSSGSGYIPNTPGEPDWNTFTARHSARAAVAAEAKSEANCDEGSTAIFNIHAEVDTCSRPTPQDQYTCEAACVFKWRCCATPDPVPVLF